MMSAFHNPALDTQRLATLERHLGDALRPIVERYFVDCAAMLESLAHHVAEGNINEIQGIAHRMKGASGTLGMLRLQSCFGIMEEASGVRVSIPDDWIPMAVHFLDEAKLAYAEHCASPRPRHDSVL